MTEYPGEPVFIWDMTDMAGMKVTEGVYRYRIEAEGRDPVEALARLGRRHRDHESLVSHGQGRDRRRGHGAGRGSRRSPDTAAAARRRR